MIVHIFSEEKSAVRGFKKKKSCQTYTHFHYIAAVSPLPRQFSLSISQNGRRKFSNLGPAAQKGDPGEHVSEQEP